MADHLTRRALVAAAAAAPLASVPALAAPADPIVEMERRYGELLAGEDDSDFEAACELLDEIVETPLTSITGVAVMARILINNSQDGWARSNMPAAAKILEWVGRQTGRNEFIGAANFENVGVEQAGARP